MSGLTLLKDQSGLSDSCSRFLVASSSDFQGTWVLPRSTLGVIRRLALLLVPWVMFRGRREALEKTRETRFGLLACIGTSGVIVCGTHGERWLLTFPSRFRGDTRAQQVPSRDYKHQETVAGGSISNSKDGSQGHWERVLRVTLAKPWGAPRECPGA